MQNISTFQMEYFISRLRLNIIFLSIGTVENILIFHSVSYTLAQLVSAQDIKFYTLMYKLVMVRFLVVVSETFPYHFPLVIENNFYVFSIEFRNSCKTSLHDNCESLGPNSVEIIIQLTLFPRWILRYW